MRTFFFILFLTASVVSNQIATAADNLSESLCINPKEDPPGPDTTVACYSDTGCAFAASLGAEPIRDYEPESAPFALARGKISAIVTSAKDLITTAEANGAKCRSIGE